jgi:hypothetical protein
MCPRRGQLELVDVLPIAIGAGIREVLGPAVAVKSVIEAFGDRVDVAAGAIRRLEEGDVVSAAHQLVAATEAGDAAAGHDHFLRRARAKANGQQGRAGNPEHVAASEGGA